MTDQHFATSTTPLTMPLSTEKTIILSGLLNGKWINTEYQLNNQDWRDALKLFRDANTTVKIRYQ
jgi:hypothetical protein